MTEPDSITKPLPRGKTATIPMDVLMAFIELQRAVEKDFNPTDLVGGGYSYESNSPNKTVSAWRKLRDLSNEVKL